MKHRRGCRCFDCCESVRVRQRRRIEDGADFKWIHTMAQELKAPKSRPEWIRLELEDL